MRIGITSLFIILFKVIAMDSEPINLKPIAPIRNDHATNDSYERAFTSFVQRVILWNRDNPTDLVIIPDEDGISVAGTVVAGADNSAGGKQIRNMMKTYFENGALTAEGERQSLDTLMGLGEAMKKETIANMTKTREGIRTILDVQRIEQILAAFEANPEIKSYFRKFQRSGRPMIEVLTAVAAQLKVGTGTFYSVVQGREIRDYVDVVHALVDMGVSSGTVSSKIIAIKEILSQLAAHKPLDIENGRVSSWIQPSQVIVGKAGANYVNYHPGTAGPFPVDKSLTVDQAQKFVSDAYAGANLSKPVLKIGEQFGDLVARAGNMLDTDLYRLKDDLLLFKSNLVYEALNRLKRDFSIKKARVGGTSYTFPVRGDTFNLAIALSMETFYPISVKIRAGKVKHKYNDSRFGVYLGPLGAPAASTAWYKLIPFGGKSRQNYEFTLAPYFGYADSMFGVLRTLTSSGTKHNFAYAEVKSTAVAVTETAVNSIDMQRPGADIGSHSRLTVNLGGKDSATKRGYLLDFRSEMKIFISNLAKLLSQTVQLNKTSYNILHFLAKRVAVSGKVASSWGLSALSTSQYYQIGFNGAGIAIELSDSEFSLNYQEFVEQFEQFLTVMCRDIYAVYETTSGVVKTFLLEGSTKLKFDLTAWQGSDLNDQFATFYSKIFKFFYKQNSTEFYDPETISLVLTDAKADFDATLIAYLSFLPEEIYSSNSGSGLQRPLRVPDNDNPVRTKEVWGADGLYTYLRDRLKRQVDSLSDPKHKSHVAGTYICVPQGSIDKLADGTSFKFTPPPTAGPVDMKVWAEGFTDWGDFVGYVQVMSWIRNFTYSNKQEKTKISKKRVSGFINNDTKQLRKLIYTFGGEPSKLLE